MTLNSGAPKPSPEAIGLIQSLSGGPDRYTVSLPKMPDVRASLFRTSPDVDAGYISFACISGHKTGPQSEAFEKCSIRLLVRHGSVMPNKRSPRKASRFVMEMGMDYTTDAGSEAPHGLIRFGSPVSFRPPGAFLERHPRGLPMKYMMCLESLPDMRHG